MSRWAVAATAIIGFVLVCVVGGAIYMYSGAYNVAATDELAGLTRYVFGTITEASIRAHAKPVEHPPTDQTELVQEGFREYREMCVMCHGAPGVEPAWVHAGMKPEPPELGHAAEELSTGELFWVVKHGIKHTGMPAMAPTHGDEEIRTIVAFVQQLPEMTEEEYAALGRQAASDTTEAAGGDGHEGHEH